VAQRGGNSFKAFLQTFIIWIFSMRSLLVLALLFGIVAWLSSPVYYFVWGRAAGKLPQHVRMTAGQTEAGCSSLVRDFDRLVPMSGVYCERVPRWKHWTNAVRNVAYQIEAYRLQKTASVE
jgi:hypothetical protein